MNEVLHKISSLNSFANIIKNSLWLSNNQILAIEVSFFVERYKRYFPKDIKAFLYTPTKQFRILNIIYFSIEILFIIFFLLASGSKFALLWLAPLLFSLSCHISHFVKGKTCDFYIITEVSYEKLKAISRVKTAQRAIKILKPLIMHTQKDIEFNDELSHDLANKEIPIQAEEMIKKTTKQHISPKIEKTFQEQKNIKYNKLDLPRKQTIGFPSLGYTTLFIIILLHGIILLLPELFLSPFIMGTILLFSCVGFLVSVAIMIKHKKNIVPASIKKSNLIYMIMVCVLFFIYYMSAYYFSMKNLAVNSVYSPNDGIYSFVSTPISKMIIIRYFHLIFAVIFCFLGLSGLFKSSKNI